MMKFILGKQINIRVFYKLMLSLCMCVARHAQSTQNEKFAYLCNIFRKTWGIMLIFYLEINMKVFCKLLISLWVCRVNAQSTQNNKFAISLQYLKENVKNEVDFLPADKHQSLLQIDSIILFVCSKGCPNYPKQQVSYFFAIA